MLHSFKQLLAIAALSALVGAGASGPAWATNAAAVIDTDIRSGPGTEFAIVDRLVAGMALVNHGCVEKNAWCRIRVGDSRGWVPGSAVVRQSAPGAMLYAGYVRPPAAPAHDVLADDVQKYQRLLYKPPRRHARDWRHKRKKFSKRGKDYVWTSAKPRYHKKKRGKKGHADHAVRAKSIKMKTSFTKSGFGLIIR